MSYLATLLREFSTQRVSRSDRTARVALAFAAALGLATLSAPQSLRAQDTILARGDLVTSGFSGIRPSPAPLVEGADPLDEFFIDLDGASAQIQSPAAAGQAPAGQLLPTVPKLRIKASHVGQVNAIALDDGLEARTPNIYLGATSAYGLNIVIPDADGDGYPERVKKGMPNAQWMAGQFGPDGSGAGAIWKIDGRGSATLFATVPGNSGAGIGDIVFDRASRQFFAASLDDGLIYRIGQAGQVIDNFDHGVAGRPSQGLAAVSDDGSQIDLASPSFDTLNPDTWAMTPRERRVHGLAVRDDRLYYAVDGQVWSIAISAAGFGGDARWELDTKGLAGDGPVADMLFDGDGHLYAAQRGSQRNSYDYSVFAEPEKSSVARYRREDPNTKSRWVEEPETYAIGLPPEHTRADGGIALGYGHDETGALRTNACAAMLWSTGHRLRTSDEAEAEEAAAFDVHGLQGNDVTLVQPQNTPPQQSYFIDYDGLFGDAAKSGHVGDVEIWQPCEGAPDFATMTPPQGFAVPPGFLPPGTLPPPWYPPPPPPPPPHDHYETNLKLKKRATPKQCAPFFGGFLCQYTVRVTNTGPDAYFGPIVIRDWLPANPPGAGVFANWPCWNAPGPTNVLCWQNPVFLLPGASTTMTVFVTLPGTYDKCHVRNSARIEWAPGGSVWNTDPTDDMDSAGSIVPDKDCKDDPDKTDLKIYKDVTAVGCFEWNGGIRCAYRVFVENQGPGTYNGNIVVKDTIPNGTTAIFSGPVGTWTTPCPSVGNVYTCTHPGANLPPVTSTAGLIVRIDLSKAKAKELGCKVENKVEITFAPSPSNQNTDPTNDDASATAIVPAEICDPDVTKTDLRIKKEGAAGIDCFEWNGGLRCGYRIEVINNGPGPFNGPIEIEDTIPAGATATFSGPGGWTLPCMAAGNVYTCKHPGANLPAVLSSVFLNVRVDLPKALAKQLDCKVRNDVRITVPAAPSNQNTNPANDAASAIEIVPAHICEPPVSKESNLKITKIAPANAICKHPVGSWCRVFKLTVTNTGPFPFNGNIKLTDTPSVGSISAIGGAGWTCVGSACHTNAAVALQKNPPSADETGVHVTVSGTGAEARAANCKLTNTATITDPLGLPQNAIAADDSDQITVDLPAELCNEPVPKTNLKIEKLVDDNGCLRAAAGQGLHCYFNILVTNTGPGAFNDKIVVDDILPAGSNAVFGAGAWACAGTTCTHPVVALAKDEKVVLSVQVNVPQTRLCIVPNTAKLTYPAGGADNNTDGSDDQSQAVAANPDCADAPTPPTCPPGYTWNGEKCDRGNPTCRTGWTATPVSGTCCPPGKPWNRRSKQCGDDDTPPPPECPTGMTATPVAGKCCPRGEPWNPRTRQCGSDDDTPPPPVCPPGLIGAPPNCKQPPVICKKTARCLNGLSWSFDTCACVCAGDRVMKHGKCVADDPKCPKGMLGTPPNCRPDDGPPPKVCPPGTHGKWPRCKPDVKDCPKGMIGKYPNCKPRFCPRGTEGRWPVCKPIIKHCPAGMIGKPPHCKVKPPRHCPPGTLGRWPRCKPIVKPCPPGTFGKPPRCKRINLIKPPRLHHGPGVRFPGGRPPRLIMRPNFGGRGLR